MFSLILNPDLNMYAPVHANTGTKSKIWLMKGESKSREGGGEHEGGMEEKEKISSVFSCVQNLCDQIGECPGRERDTQEE